MERTARRPGRPARTEGPSTRERLLDASLELFARHGYAATSVRMIAAEVGIRDSAIYAHFPSKQAIYAALFDEAGPVSTDAIDVDLDQLAESEPAVGIPLLVRKIIAAWSTPRARLFASVLLREGSPDGRGMSGVAAMVAQARTRLEPPFRAWLAAGKLRSDLDAEQLVWELATPLAALRFLHLHADATRSDLAAVRRLADRHAAFLVTTTTLERS
jgi:AcrR family transcriptional regulator